MDRLTEWHCYPDNVRLARVRFPRMRIECDCEDYCKIQESCESCEIQDAFNRLAAYEDTGLTPEEITTMKSEYSDTFQVHLNELLNIKDKRIAELEAENVRLHKLIDNIECVMRGEIGNENA